MAQAYRCTVVTPEKQVLDEQVTHVSIPAWDGQIGLLHLRAPLLAKLGYGPLKLELASGDTKTLFVGGGFAQMKDDELAILTDEAIDASAINRTDAEAALKEALALRGIGDEEADRRDRQVNRARAMVALASG